MWDFVDTYDATWPISPVWSFEITLQSVFFYLLICNSVRLVPFYAFVESSVAVGPDSTRLTCPSCRASIATRVEHEASGKTHIIALILCLFICWWVWVTGNAWWRLFTLILFIFLSLFSSFKALCVSIPSANECQVSNFILVVYRCIPYCTNTCRNANHYCPVWKFKKNPRRTFVQVSNYFSELQFFLGNLQIKQLYQ